MALAQEDLQLIHQIIDQSFLSRPEVYNANVRYELDIRERMVRVEEELKYQRELMFQGFETMDKRFEEARINSDKRFEQMDKRFEQIDKRFEQIDKRFEESRAASEKRFEESRAASEKRFEQIDKRFEQMDKRFEEARAASEKRFEQVDKHLMSIAQRLDRFMFWSLGLTISAVVAIVKLA